jgi:hypothetical protein
VQTRSANRSGRLAGERGDGSVPQHPAASSCTPDAELGSASSEAKEEGKRPVVCFATSYKKSTYADAKTELKSVVERVAAVPVIGLILSVLGPEATRWLEQKGIALVAAPQDVLRGGKIERLL